mmetsp:Transcript_23978/g.76532  ORF Transcript_23978/g.76532 Transcript_23978/m.76532 type:complete len:83 (+) Transcript_23978:270-518(+)
MPREAHRFCHPGNRDKTNGHAQASKCCLQMRDGISPGVGNSRQLKAKKVAQQGLSRRVSNNLEPKTEERCRTQKIPGTEPLR